MFIADTDRLVLKPLERMVELVRGRGGPVARRAAPVCRLHSAQAWHAPARPGHEAPARARASTRPRAARPPACAPSQLREVSENPLASIRRQQRASGKAGGGGSGSTASSPGTGAGLGVKQGCCGRSRAAKEPQALETQVLEQSIHKICSLLSVRGVGRAPCCQRLRRAPGLLCWQELRGCRCGCPGRQLAPAAALTADRRAPSFCTLRRWALARRGPR